MVGSPRGAVVKGSPSDATGLYRQMMASVISREHMGKQCVGQTPALGKMSNFGQKMKEQEILSKVYFMLAH